MPAEHVAFQFLHAFFQRVDPLIFGGDLGLVCLQIQHQIDQRLRAGLQQRLQLLTRPHG